MNETLTPKENTIFRHQLKRQLKARGIESSKLLEGLANNKPHFIENPRCVELLNGSDQPLAKNEAQKICEFLGKDFSEMTSGAIPVEWNGKLKDAQNTDAGAIGGHAGAIALNLWIGGVMGITKEAFGAAKKIANPTPGKAGWILIVRGMLDAIIDLTKPLFDTLPTKIDLHEFVEIIKEDIITTLHESSEVIDQDFFRDPASNFVPNFKPILLKQLISAGIEEVDAKNIERRLDKYFAKAMTSEFTGNPQKYSELEQTSLFQSALEKHEKWLDYNWYLARLPQEPVFMESFGLDKVFVDLRCFFDQKPLPKPASTREQEPENDYETPNTIRTYSTLKWFLSDWLVNQRVDYNRDEAVRFLSGGPGSGKSSSVKSYAYELGETFGAKVVLAPLHKVSMEGNFQEGMATFCREHQPTIPIEWLDSKAATKSENRLLLIFDGLDELAMTDKGGAEAAKSFVKKTKVWLGELHADREVCILFVGRPIAVSSTEDEFSKPIVLNLLSYIFTKPADESILNRRVDIEHRFVGPESEDSITRDQRSEWWDKFADGKNEIPERIAIEFKKSGSLDELTREPLLCYLVAKSLELAINDGDSDSLKIDGLNHNDIYDQMLRSVKRRVHADCKQLPSTSQIPDESFAEILEEIGLSAWHDSSRMVSKNDLEKSYLNEKQNALLTELGQKGDFESGLIGLMLGFFFRESAKDQTTVYEFTHKSFCEYLAARRLIYGVHNIYTQLQKRENSNGREIEGWDFETALVEWCRLFGPTRLTADVTRFLKDELFRKQEKKEVYLPGNFEKYREMILQFLHFQQRHGLPLHQSEQFASFHSRQDASRNAEEALFVMHHTFCIALQESTKLSPEPKSVVNVQIKNEDSQEPIWSAANSFGSQLVRIIGQRTTESAEPILESLGFLDFGSEDLGRMQLSGVNLCNSDLHKANFNMANLTRAILCDSKLEESNFKSATLSRANLNRSDLTKAQLQNANLDHAQLIDSILVKTNLEGANLRGANFGKADLASAALDKADLMGAKLVESKLDSAKFDNALLLKANLIDATLHRASFEHANLIEAKLQNADLSHANLRYADLILAELSNATLQRADLSHANLNCAELNGADLTLATLDFAKLSWANLSGANLSKANLNGTNLSKANLTGTILDGVNLSNKNLAEANLNNAKLVKANLTKATLSDANLRGADLHNAKLIEADLRNADLSNAILVGAKLGAANLARAKIEGVNLANADLAGANLRGAFIYNSSLHKAILYNARLIEANLNRADLSEADARKANLSRATINDANLVHAIFNQADLSDSRLSNSNLSHAVLSYVNFTKADLSNAVLQGANLSHANLVLADLTDADLNGADLAGADLSGAKLKKDALSSVQKEAILGEPEYLS